MKATERALEGIAIVGMAGRFPGAADIDTLWARLCAGEELLTRFTPEELLSAGVPDSLINDPRYVPVNGVLEEADLFDPDFFGMSPREAAITDPQHRVFLELAWHALENAGIDTKRYRGVVGVFAGCGSSTYMLNHLIPERERLADVGDLRVRMGNGQEYLATRAAYKFNLTGPSLSINTACSTSLVAVHVACDSLLNYQCDAALAGGISIQLPQLKGYLYESGGILSPDGHCRAFDAAASGTVNGNGGAVVVLKRLSDAIAGRHTVYAVIRGTAVTNDGSEKAGYTAPSVTGQSRAIEEAAAVSGVSADAIGYVETHGTGTPLGDPIEFAGLTAALRKQTKRVRFCAIGSIKTNLGHLDEAAGVTGLVKVALSLHHCRIPASLHFDKPNPEMAYMDSPFYVNARSRIWESPPNGHQRAAGVSSFGIGGTNAHVILEEGPRWQHYPAGRPFQLLPISATCPERLLQHAEQLSGFLNNCEEDKFPDVAWTLQSGRRAFAARQFVVAANTAEACVGLHSITCKQANQPACKEPTVVFLFSGQGSQRPYMAAGLYACEPVFREAIDTCFNHLKILLGGVDLRPIVYPDGTAEFEGSERYLTRTEYAQPALFAVEYALAGLLGHFGIKATAMLGHSIGEYVAACLCGAMDLETALAAVVARSRLMQSAPEGAMIAVALGESEARRYVSDGIEIAAVNAPDRCVLAGKMAAIEDCARMLDAAGAPVKRLHVSHAFHSASMEPVLHSYLSIMRGNRLRVPHTRWVSNVTGNWISAEQATDPAYYVEHVRKPVQFAEGVRTLANDCPDPIFLEVGPGSALTQLAQRSTAAVCLPSCTESDVQSLLMAVGDLWTRGVNINWDAFGEAGRTRVAVPGYPFAKMRCWIDAKTDGQKPKLKRRDPSRWFYTPTWKRSSRLHGPTVARGQRPWIVFAGEAELGARFASQVGSVGHRVITVRAAGEYRRASDSTYLLRPGNAADFDALTSDLARDGVSAPFDIAHFWCVDRCASFQDTQNRGFYSLVFLAREIARRGWHSDVSISVISSGIYDVTGNEALDPPKASVVGAVQVLSQEYPGIVFRNLDVCPDEIDDGVFQRLVIGLDLHAGERIAALRGHYLWTQQYETSTAVNGTPLLRKDGVYLITGGLGRIGSILAEYLIAKAGAKVIVTGRSVTVSDPTQRPEGRHLWPVRADVGNVADMERVVNFTESRFGQINGVIHAAAVPATRSVQTADEVELSLCEEHFRVKARGLEVLEQVLANRRPDFVLLFSSLSTVLGGLGFAAYAAANHIANAIVRKNANRSTTTWMTVNWDGWQTMASDMDSSYAITPDEGWTAFDNVFARWGTTELVVSTGDLHDRLERWINIQTAVVDAEASVEKQVSQGGEGEVVEQVAALWRATLGLSKIRNDENFFKLNGDSLTASQLVARMNQQFGSSLTLRDFFETPTVEAVAVKITTATALDTRSIPKVDPAEYYPLTRAQKRLWILCQDPKASLAYNMSYALSVRGQLNRDALRRAFQTVIGRHDILRTAFVTVRSEPKQQVRLATECTLALVEAQSNDVIEREMRAEALTPFRLEDPPLLRAKLIEATEDRHVLLFTLHHIVADGLSLNVLMRELDASYAAFSRGGEPELPALPIQFKDFAVWQNQQIGIPAMQDRRSYWLNKLAGHLPVLDLPIDKARPQHLEGSGGHVIVRFSTGLRERLNAVCREHGVTLFSVLTASAKVLLSGLTGQDDIIVATPVAGREQPELNNQIGYYLNNVVLRDVIRRSEPFATLLRRVHTTITDALANQEYPFDLLVEELAVPSHPGHAPITDVQVNLMPAQVPDLKLGDLTVAGIGVPAETTLFDLNFMFSDSSAGLALELAYASSLFEHSTALRVAGQLMCVLEGIAEDPDRTVRSLCRAISEEPAGSTERERFLAAALRASEGF